MIFEDPRAVQKLIAGIVEGFRHDAPFRLAVLVHRQSPVKDGYFAHAIPAQIDSPKMRPAIARRCQ